MPNAGLEPARLATDGFEPSVSAFHQSGKWCIGVDSNHQRVGLQPTALPIGATDTNGTGDGTRTRSGTVFKTGLFTIFNTPAFGIGLWIRTTTSSFGDCHATVTSSPCITPGKLFGPPESINWQPILVSGEPPRVGGDPAGTRTRKLHRERVVTLTSLSTGPYGFPLRCKPPSLGCQRGT